ncbi:MAG: glycosyltransferase [Bacteroidetes Order II. Incertae sedis bacterium]|mgnify:FL=1|jgi:glycosyltransferase involved in cell wall biosynthesis|nr:glycosyltransferase [Bacteroidetes Order II. bacterium]MBT5248946.1 glycosyltransferase [Bacteroidetes Order II. bacterium]MBT7400582.1 glycosyltransferase [Bacteroidetes Order II. bacterium]
MQEKKSYDIVFAITGDLHRNIRALKQLRSLSESDFTVFVLHLGGNTPPSKLPKGVTEKTVQLTDGSGPRYFWRLSNAFKKAMVDIPARVYHASDLYTLRACATISAKHSAVYTFDSREYYAHVSATTGRPWVRWWWNMEQRQFLRGAAGICTVSESIANALSKDFSIPKPVIVENTPEATGTEDGLSIREMLTERGIEDNRDLIAHIGQMKKDRGCEQLVLSMKQVPDAHLVFLGYGPIQPELERLTAEHSLSERIHFLPPVPPRAIQNALVGVSIGITMLLDTCLNHRYALPNKLFDYIRAGVPVLGADLVEMRRVIKRYDIGQTADSNDPNQISKALKSMLNSEDLSKWSANALTATETFTWSNASQRFLGLINQAVPKQ